MGPAASVAYLSSLILRLGRKANHQMLTMVASKPKAAAGLASFLERSDTGPTLAATSGASAEGHGPVAALASRRIEPEDPHSSAPHSPSISVPYGGQARSDHD